MRDRTCHDQQHRAAGCNLVAAAIVLWNTVYLTAAVEALRRGGLDVPDGLLRHVWPLGRDHVSLTGDRRWSADNPKGLAQLRPLRLDRLGAANPARQGFWNSPSKSPYQASFAGESDRDDVSLLALQPFGMPRLGQGWYARSTGLWTHDFEHDHYAILIGMGLGKIIPTEKVAYNAFVEPRYSVDTKRPGQDKWQIFAGLNFRFK